jgi:hypothetical protein
LVKSPFTFDVGVLETAQEEFIEMINDTGVRSDFSSFLVSILSSRALALSGTSNQRLKNPLLFPPTLAAEKEVQLYY